MDGTEEVSDKLHFCCGGSGAILLKHLRIVLLSDRISGKPSAASIILGPECSGPNTVTLQCVRRRGEAAGRQLTLIEAQAWRDYELPILKTTPRLVKQEILTSVVACAPGPHAFLLVIHEDMVFSEQMRNALSDHIAVLGEAAWSYAIVLFITYEPLAEKTEFKVKGKMLQWLVEKCGNRYHVLNVDHRSDTRVAELLEKIEKVVAGNGGCHFEMDRDVLEDEEERQRTQKLMADERMKIVQRQRYALRAAKGCVRVPELGIVLLGSKGSGKSSCGNTILGREEFRVGIRSAVCVLRQGSAAGRQLTVVEVPGWQGCCPPECSPYTVDREIMRSEFLCDPPQQNGPVAFLLVIRADECFNETFRQPIEGLLSPLAEGEVFDRTMVLFTCGDWLGDTTIEQHIESEGEALKWLVEKCGNRYHVINNNNNNNNNNNDNNDNHSGVDTQVTELLDKIEEMVAENGGRNNQRDRGLMQEDEDRGLMQEDEDREKGTDTDMDGKTDAAAGVDWGGDGGTAVDWGGNAVTDVDADADGDEDADADANGDGDEGGDEDGDADGDGDGDEGGDADVHIDLDMQAEEMKRRTLEQRERIRATHGITQLPELRIVLFGFGFTGKSSTGNTILGRQAFELCCAESPVWEHGEVAGRALTLIEPPTGANSDHNSDNRLQFLRESLPSRGGVHAFLLLVRIDVGFDELMRQIVEYEVELFGERVWKHIIVVFTFGDWLGDTTSIEQHIVREDEALKWLIEKCGNRYHVINNRCSDSLMSGQSTRSSRQVVELLEKVEDMVAVNRGVTFEY